MIGSLVLLIMTSALNAQSDSLAFGDKKKVPDGLEGKIYALTPTTLKLPNFDTMKPIGTIYTKKIDVPTRDWRSGFPGAPERHEWFGIVYKGSIKAKKPGHYTLRLLSDDGAKLYIDKKLVIDNDGIHGPGARLGEFEFDGSSHQFRLEYFQGPETQLALQLFATYDKEMEEVFPGNNFTLTTPTEGTPFKVYLIYAGIALILFLTLWIWMRRKRKIPVD